MFQTTDQVLLVLSIHFEPALMLKKYVHYDGHYTPIIASVDYDIYSNPQTMKHNFNAGLYIGLFWITLSLYIYIISNNNNTITKKSIYIYI